METDTKIHELNYSGGLSLLRNDWKADDNELSESMNIVNDGDGIRPIQDPVKAGETSSNDDTLICVHRTGEEGSLSADRWIAWDGTNLKWASAGGTTYTNFGTHSSFQDISYVGNTLLFNDGEHIHYYLWKAQNSSYSYLGTQIPDVRVEFGLSEPTPLATSDMETRFVNLDGLINNGEGWDQLTLKDGNTVMSYIPDVEVDKKQEFNNACSGLAMAQWRAVQKKKGFMFPFFVTWAVRLYDNSYVMHGCPVLMYPSVTANSLFFTVNSDGDIASATESGNIRKKFAYQPSYSLLRYTLKYDQTAMSTWGDIIKGVDIFVSDDVKNYKADGNWSIPAIKSLISSGGISTNIYYKHTTLIDGEEITYLQDGVDLRYQRGKGVLALITSDAPAILWPEHKTKKEIINELKERGIFYKIISLEKEDLQNNVEKNAEDDMTEYTLQTLDANDRLDNDYYSRTERVGVYNDNYNSRIHLQNIRRGFFDGFTRFTQLPGNDQYQKSFDVYVEIKTDSGMRCVHETALLYQNPFLWFYYPDPRATRVWFISPVRSYMVSLKEHTQLNGAYFIDDIPSYGDPIPIDHQTSETAPTVNNTFEHMHNHVLVSEAGNPFLWKAEGDIAVGNGAVLGIAMNVTALPELEFGKHQLLVFTEEGIWALKTNNDGLYDSADPFSREVCSNHRSITETDSAVFFATRKGLMRVIGNDVKCVSLKLGNLLVDKDYMVAYDYKDSKLWLLRNNETVPMYDMKTQTWWAYTLEGTAVNVVNSYPDTLIQVEGVSKGQVLSLIQRPTAEEDENEYTGHLVTKPLKLGSLVMMKSIRQMRHLFTGGDLSLTLEGSDDILSWRTLTSTRGKGWKFYRIRLDWDGAEAIDRISSTVIQTQSRRGDPKL